ncbi:MAG: hypothetical protein US42_C0015G0015 [Candidatus Magasanikbacteria bacterium GW2011_GWC2_37_14]|uniref:Uncharacterized protein n=1 Tax=Candidatus Magasanikbacteria bacterium GW2011_GWC2_37_14 TaxID=1619046 RepID=A0A0G0GAR1_9BACT|nr:MAG: hypothetical protein US42_C0015G0015 [Candidatus Magasanikbacteria bacterium GW2011_GWC2_37_14]
MFVKPKEHLVSSFNQNFKKTGAAASLNGVIKHVLHKQPDLPEYKRRLTYQTIHKLNNDPTQVFNTKQTREIIEGMGEMLQYKYKKNGALHTLRHLQRVFRKNQTENKKELSSEEKAKEEKKIKNRNLIRNREGREEESEKEDDQVAVRSLGLVELQEASVSASQALQKNKKKKEEEEEEFGVEQPLVDLVID